MIDRVSFHVPGQPVGKGRPRFTRDGRTYTPPTTAAWERKAKSEAALVMAGLAPLDGPLFVSIVATFRIPKSWPKAKRAAALAGELLHVTTPDADNLIKAALDSGNGIVYRDDCQVVEVRCVKRYGAVPGTTVSVVAAGPVARPVEFIPTEEAA